MYLDNNRDDEIIRNQMKTIGDLINRNLMNLAEAFEQENCKSKPSYEKPAEDKHDNIVPFPINRRT